MGEKIVFQPGKCGRAQGKGTPYMVLVVIIFNYIMYVFASLLLRFYSDGKRTKEERTWYEHGTKEVRPYVKFVM